MFEDAEKRVNRRGGITYWKDGNLIGRRCSKCGEDKLINEFGFLRKKGLYNSECKKCCCERTKKRYHEKQEHNTEYQRKRQRQQQREWQEQWREKNKEKKREYNKRYRENNEEKVKECRKYWRENNIEHIREYNRQWGKREYDKQWKENNKEVNLQNISNALEQINPIFKQLNLPVYGYVYMFENTKTGHKYIGQTFQPLKERYKGGIVKGWIKERKEKQSQKFLNELTENDIEVTEMLDVAFCKYHLDKLEAHYINKYNSCNNGYNNREGKHKTNDGIEEFNKILEENGLEFIDGELIKKVM